MAEATAYLKRAYGLAKEVGGQLEEFRQHVITHDQSIDQMKGVGGFFASIQGGRQLAQEKGRLQSDLQLAWSELDRGATIDPNAEAEMPDGVVWNVPLLRATVLLARGQLEMHSGTTTEARRLLLQSLECVEIPATQYFLGLAYEFEYNPSEALKHFERCLEIEPDGDLAVAALREANDMRNYKKRFRGSWGTFFLLFLFCLPIAPVYFIMKYR